MSLENQDPDKLIKVLRILAALVAFAGCYLIYELVRDGMHSGFKALFASLNPFKSSAHFFQFFIGYWFITAGWSAWRHQTGENLKSLLFILALILFVLLNDASDWVVKRYPLHTRFLIHDPRDSFGLFFSALVCTLLNFGCRAWLGRSKNLSEKDHAALLQPPDKAWLMLQAFLLSMMGFDLIGFFVDRIELDGSAGEQYYFWMGCIQYIFPVALAWFYYRRIYRWLCRLMQQDAAIYAASGEDAQCPG